MRLEGRLHHECREPYIYVDERGHVLVRLDSIRGTIGSAEVLWRIKQPEGKPVLHRIEMEKYLTNSYRETFIADCGKPETTFVYFFRVVSTDNQISLYTSMGTIAEDSTTFREEGQGDCYFQLCWNFLHERSIVPMVAKEKGVVYQIFPDRFAIGDTQKECLKDKNLKEGERPDYRSFFGGDLLGIEKHLDFLADLGVKTVYMTPVWKSASNHRYDVEDYREVDRRLGGDAALQSLSEQIHKRGMKLVLDAVFNHTSYQHPWFQDVLEKGQSSPYYHWYLIDGDRPDSKKRNYRTFASALGMPKLNTENQAVIAECTDTIQYLTQKFKVDGWRFDVADEIAHRFWVEMHQTIKDIDPAEAMIAEDWLTSENFVDRYEFDSTMNYQIRKIILDTLAETAPLTPQEAADRITDLLLKYTWVQDLSMLNLVSSHDTPRFLSLVKSREKALLGIAIAITFPGMFMAYYGDEFGMEGGRDPDNRRAIDWNHLEQSASYFEKYRELMRVAALPAVREGRVQYIATRNFLTCIRENRDEKVILVGNLSNTPHRLHLDQSEIVAAAGVTEEVIAPYGYVITKLKKR